MDDVSSVPISTLDLDPVLQLRPLDEENVLRLMEVLDDLDPVEVFKECEGARLRNWLANGYHRLEAHRRAGRTHIMASLRDGSKRDALLHAIATNGRSGLPLSREDKRRAIEHVLADPELGKLSSRAIADRCRVDHKTVEAIRKRSGESPQMGADPAVRTVTRGGSQFTMDVSNIGGGAPAAADDAGDDADVELQRPPDAAQGQGAGGGEPRARQPKRTTGSEGRGGMIQQAVGALRLALGTSRDAKEWATSSAAAMRQQFKEGPLLELAVAIAGEPDPLVVAAIEDAKRYAGRLQGAVRGLADKPTRRAQGQALQLLAKLIDTLDVLGAPRQPRRGPRPTAGSDRARAA
jgi:hypothetical protein